MSSLAPGAWPPQPSCMHELLAEQAVAHPDRIFCIFDDRELSYSATWRHACGVAAGLRMHGLGKGAPVILMLDNRSETLILYFALALVGALAVPVNPALKGQTLAHLLELTGADYAIVEGPYVERMAEAMSGLRPIANVYVLGGPTTGWPGARPFATLQQHEKGFVPADVAPGDPWGVLFTSGTTGEAKGVLLPHQQLMSAAWDAAHDMEMSQDSVFYTFNPLFHLNAIIYGPLAALISGARAVVRTRFPKSNLLADLRSTGATHWTSTSFTLRGLLDQPPSPDDADNALQILVGYGVTLDEVRAFEGRFGGRIQNGYGSSESGLVCRTQSRRPDACGPVSDRHEMRIVDENGRDLPPGSVGEVWTRSRHPFDRFLGYFRNPEADAAAFSGDWFRTGDLGRLDEEGCFHFHDRLKDSLKRRGENISCHEVEIVLRGHPSVLDAAVVGFRPSIRSEEEVRAFVELSEGNSPSDTVQRLVEHCQHHLAYFMVPRFVDIMDALPRNALGKVEKARLKALPITPDTIDVKAAGFEVAR